MSGNSIHIAICFDDNFWAPAYAVMRSVCLTSKRRADIVFHICHDGLSSEHRAALEAIASEFGAQLRDYALQDHATFNSVARSLPVAKRLHSVIYARMLLDLLLPKEVERVIYLDCDTMVIAPIEELWAADLGEKAIGAVADGWALFQMGGRDMVEKKGLFDTAQPYFNSGVLLIDRARYAAADIPGRVAQMGADGILNRLYYDQDMLNLIFSNNWQALDWRFNVIDPRPPHQAMGVKILHYTGKRRPWNLWSGTAFARAYRHVMTNDVYYRFMGERRKRALLRLIGRK